MLVWSCAKYIYGIYGNNWRNMKYKVYNWKYLLKQNILCIVCYFLRKIINLITTEFMNLLFLLDTSRRSIHLILRTADAKEKEWEEKKNNAASLVIWCSKLYLFNLALVVIYFEASTSIRWYSNMRAILL